MHQAPAHDLFAAIDSSAGQRIPEAPPSGVRLRVPAKPGVILRKLAGKAESLGLDPLAFELFFVASRLDATGRIDVARRELDLAAMETSDIEARFYRRAARSLEIEAGRLSFSSER